MIPAYATGATTGVFGRAIPLTFRPSRVTVGVAGVTTLTGWRRSSSGVISEYGLSGRQAVNVACMTLFRSLDTVTLLPSVPVRFQPVICLPLLLSTGVLLTVPVPLAVLMTWTTLLSALAPQVSTLSYVLVTPAVNSTEPLSKSLLFHLSAICTSPLSTWPTPCPRRRWRWRWTGRRARRRRR